MKKLWFVVVACLLLVAFAAPAMACQFCPREGPVIASFDADTDAAPLKMIATSITAELPNGDGIVAGHEYVTTLVVADVSPRSPEVLHPAFGNSLPGFVANNYYNLTEGSASTHTGKFGRADPAVVV